MDEYVPFVETNALLCRPYTDGCDGWKLSPGWRVMTDSRGRVALEVRAVVDTPFDMYAEMRGDGLYHDHDDKAKEIYWFICLIGVGFYAANDDLYRVHDLDRDR